MAFRARVPEGMHTALDPGRSTALYRAAQEALTNVTRHARASAVEVEVEYAAGRATLTVRDDGRGFDPDVATRRGFGLLGMEERVAAWGGTLDVRSAPGEGTRLTASLPMRARGPERRGLGVSALPADAASGG